MPLIKNQTATATTATTVNEIDRTATTQSIHKTKQKANTANNTKTTATTNDTANTTITVTTNSSNRQQQKQHKQKPKPKQQKPINDTTTKRKKHYYNNNSSNNKHRKHKISLAKSVPATPVQVNPITTNQFVPSSPDFCDDDDNDDDDDDVLYMPPYSYPNCSLNILNGDYEFGNELNFNAAHTLELKQNPNSDKEEHYREVFTDSHPLELKRDNDEDSSSMAMITPPPPYDTPHSKQVQQYPHTFTQRYPHHQAAYTAPKAQRSHNIPHTRKYIFSNNREQFNISSSNGNSSSNSIHQQPQSTNFLGSTLTNAITPTKLSAAAAAMFAAPQIVQLNRKWSNLHRKRRRRNSSSGDSKELDKLVLQSVDWDENDIY